MRHRGRRRRHPRARGRPRADHAPARAGASACSRGRPARRPPDRAQLGRDPRRHLLRAGLAEGRAVRGGAAEMYEYCEDAGDPLRALRQADRRHRAPSWRASTSSSGAAGRTGSRACAGSTPTASARSSRTRPGSPPCTARAPGSSTSARSPRAYAEDLREAGGKIALGCEVRASSPARGSLRVRHSPGVTEAGHAICCAGAWSDRLAVASGADPDPRIVPFRGAYLQLVPERRDLVRSLIYPVPDPSLPFLGVHLTKRIDGEVLIGPTALLGTSGLGRTLAWPGSWRMFRRWWRTGAGRDAPRGLRRSFVAAAARYLPELERRRRHPRLRRRARPGGRPRRRPRRRLRLLEHRAGPARPQRALAGGDLLAGDRGSRSPTRPNAPSERFDLCPIRVGSKSDTLN